MHYISQIYFWNGTLHVSNRFSVHHQESSRDKDGTDSVLIRLASSQQNLYDIYLLLSIQY